MNWLRAMMLLTPLEVFLNSNLALDLVIIKPGFSGIRIQNSLHIPLMTKVLRANSQFLRKSFWQSSL
jgi:hypothetical protein